MADTETTVTIAEHTVYDVVCTRCPFTSEGHEDRLWAESVRESHEKTCEGRA